MSLRDSQWALPLSLAWRWNSATAPSARTGFSWVIKHRNTNVTIAQICWLRLRIVTFICRAELRFSANSALEVAGSEERRRKRAEGRDNDRIGETGAAGRDPSHEVDAEPHANLRTLLDRKTYLASVWPACAVPWVAGKTAQVSVPRTMGTYVAIVAVLSRMSTTSRLIWRTFCRLGPRWRLGNKSWAKGCTSVATSGESSPRRRGGQPH